MWANERANGSQAGAPAVDASFASEASLDEPYTLSQESLNEDSRTTAELQESETSTDELMLEPPLPLPTKRSSGSKRSHQPQRKRGNTGESGDGGHSHGSAVHVRFAKPSSKLMR